MAVLAFFTALFIAGAAISAGLAFYFVRKVDYKNGEASAMFALIFAVAAFILFLVYLGQQHQAIERLKAGASMAKVAATAPPANLPGVLAALKTATTT